MSITQLVIHNEINTNILTYVGSSALCILKYFPKLLLAICAGIVQRHAYYGYHVVYLIIDAYDWFLDNA